MRKDTMRSLRRIIPLLILLVVSAAAVRFIPVASRESDQLSATIPPPLAAGPSNMLERAHPTAPTIRATRRQLTQDDVAAWPDQARDRQEAAMGEADPVVALVLQELAEHGIPPRDLIRHVLTSDHRGVVVRCYAWYAARLTLPGDREIAAWALTGLDTEVTEATKTAFDYLAASNNRWMHLRSDLDEAIHAWGERFQGVPADADPISIATADAYLRAVPSLLPAEVAVIKLSRLLDHAESPEVRLSALEQLVSLHVTGAAALASELQQVQHRLPELFPDPVKQVRAKLRLQRIASAGVTS